MSSKDSENADRYARIIHDLENQITRQFTEIHQLRDQNFCLRDRIRKLEREQKQTFADKAILKVLNDLRK